MEKSKVTVSVFEDILGRFHDVWPGLFRRLGKIESGFFSKALDNYPIDRPIYITGLARSGTTILLECLSSHPLVATHCYRDYPLLDIPLFWNRFLDRAAKTNDSLIERFHKDRIFITATSPESMEEMIWMSFFPACHDPKKSQVLDADCIASDFEEYYKSHIQKILFLRKGSRYVSKANYHISRLCYLKKLFPDVRFVIPFRDPTAHVGSLLRQHRYFCEEEEKAPRILDYMRRSGHFEFGLDRRPIHTGDRKIIEDIQELWRNKEEVRGLAKLWASVYRFVVNTLMNDGDLLARSILVHYDDLCESPAVMLRNIYRHCELEVEEGILNTQASGISAPSYYAPLLTEKETDIVHFEAAGVYKQMLKLAGRE